MGYAFGMKACSAVRSMRSCSAAVSGRGITRAALCIFGYAFIAYFFVLLFGLLSLISLVALISFVLSLTLRMDDRSPA